MSALGSKKLQLLAVSIGIVYLWFGGLKFFPGLSPAEKLAIDTIDVLCFGCIPARVAITLLAIWETTIGIALILNIYRKFIIIAALIHLFFTFTPLLFFPELSFNQAPVALTLVGQYIIKNLILISALLIIYPVSQNSIKENASAKFAT